LKQTKVKPIFLAPNIRYYTELMLKFASKDLEGITPNIHFLAGIIGQMQFRTNGTQFDAYYSPMAAIKYTIKPKERKTFDSVDSGVD
jgi:hypothetical protein